MLFVLFQVVHKNLLMAAVTLGRECSSALNKERQAGTIMDKGVPARYSSAEA